MTKQANDVLRRDFQSLTDLREMRFQKEVGKPRQQHIGADRS